MARQPWGSHDTDAVVRFGSERGRGESDRLNKPSCIVANSAWDMMNAQKPAQAALAAARVRRSAPARTLSP
eukprot:3074199-Rhodomonas_salina.2